MISGTAQLPKYRGNLWVEKSCLLKCPSAWGEAMELKWFFESSSVHLVTLTCKHKYQGDYYKNEMSKRRVRGCTSAPCTHTFANKFYHSLHKFMTRAHTHTPSIFSQKHLPFLTNPWKVLITEKPDVMCCAIFRDIHIRWRWEAEPLLLSHLPQEAVNTSWPPLEASSWVWRLLLEPRGPPALTAATSLSVKHTQIHKHSNALT